MANEATNPQTPNTSNTTNPEKKDAQGNFSDAAKKTTSTLNFKDITPPPVKEEPKVEEKAPEVPETAATQSQAEPTTAPATPAQPQPTNAPESNMDLSKLTVAAGETAPIEAPKVDLNAEQPKRTKIVKEEEEKDSPENAEEEKQADPGVEKSASIMLSANKTDAEKGQAEMIKMDALGLANEELQTKQIQDIEESKKKIVLGDSGIGFDLNGRRFKMSYWKIFYSSFLFAAIFGVISGLLWSYNKYLNISSQGVVESPYDQIVEKYDRYELMLSQYLPFSDYEKYADLKLIGSRSENNLNRIINAPKTTYVNKKNIIQRDIDEVSQAILGHYQTLNRVKQDITKYGFLSKEMYDIMQKQNNMQPIKKSLLSLEVIKFSSAMRVFSYLDTFLEGFASSLRWPVSDVESKLQNLLERGEKDIFVYLNNCYLNPFEWDYDCNVVADFDEYYKTVLEDLSFDKTFFKQLMEYIDLKLEQTEIPSFSIIFRKFDPSKEQITFNIDVNTFQKDEIALLQKNILNPHIFVVTQLLNLLKQSVFVVGESIDIKKLDVKSREVQLGSQTFTINNSRMGFTLPIQKSTQREIYDFVEEVDNRYDATRSVNFTSDITTDHASAGSTGTGAGDENLDDVSFLDTTVSLESGFEANYAKELLELQRDKTRVSFLIQEQGEDLVIAEWATELDALQRIDGYTQQQIADVLEYIITAGFLDAGVIDLGMLRQENADGVTLFELLYNQMEADRTRKATAQVPVQTDTGTTNTGDFREVRDYYESGNE